jgi:hypothetical protein
MIGCLSSKGFASQASLETLAAAYAPSGATNTGRSAQSPPPSASTMTQCAPRSPTTRRPCGAARCRTTILDPYLPFNRDTLAQYPRLRATRLVEMVRANGYAGSVVQLRWVVHTLRPAATPTVYRRLTTLMAEEAQVDFNPLIRPAGRS